MSDDLEHRVIVTRQEYRQHMQRAAELRRDGATAETCRELAAIEAAIARYALISGKPARRKGRPPRD